MPSFCGWSNETRSCANETRNGDSFIFLFVWVCGARSSLASFDRSFRAAFVGRNNKSHDGCIKILRYESSTSRPMSRDCPPDENGWGLGGHELYTQVTM
jgi:hypothetical protein